ncbi:hypothetical protein KSP39_PZI011361 [Platanthera zijinensis]|uniref:Hydroxyproline-rich glycoprotein family protein n=1 Tax=Platanthera zijinensis TaxID=2320716 RepID=A0AAP0G5N4_9ASPA
MRSSLKKLRGLGLQRSEPREKQEHRPRAKLDELVQAVQDMQDMKCCYDGLLSAAAATANSAYEFSEALREMGTCLLEKTALHDDEDSGRVLLMLGKAQFEVQKLVDNYRTHVIQTISTPSECLLGELQIVEEMKQQCDDKRELYKSMLTAPRVKGKSKNSKGEAVTLQQLQTAREDYEEDANLFIFRLKSLKQGQSRSLLTQAARHHAAQLNFFRKGLKSLELIAPHVKAITEQQHIDYHFRGLEDDYTDFDDDGGSFCSDSSNDGDLSFDYGLNEHNNHTTNSMEVDKVDIVPTSTLSSEVVQEQASKNQAEPLFRNQKPSLVSQSAPIFAHNKFDSSERMKEAPPPSTRKYHTYVLPTPVEVKNSTTNTYFSSTLPKSNSAIHTEQKPSPPLEQHRPAELKDKNLPSPTRSPKALPVPTESPILEPKQMKWQAFSGPLMAKSGSKGTFSTNYGPPRSVSPGLSISNTSPPISSLKIGTLHELPRPPISAAQRGAPASLIGHSAPLTSRAQEPRTAGKLFAAVPQTPSPLPAPPAFVPRSFSIPYRGQKRTVGTGNKQLEFPRILNLTEEAESPPLTPLSLTSFVAASPSPPEARK